MTTGYTALLTPTDILISDALHGVELDFTSQNFWNWYNDDTKPEQRVVSGCGIWYSHDAGDRNVTFPTCPAAQDQTSMAMAGILASQATYGDSATIVRVVDKMIANSTGGVVPVGSAGLPGFAQLAFTNWDSNTTYSAYNYSLVQQGLTADVNCQESVSSPISRTIVQQIPITNSATGGSMIVQNFTFEDGDCGQFVNDNSVISAAMASIGTLLCQPQPDLKLYTYNLRPFDAYANPESSRVIPNITCSIKPAITWNRVNFTSADNIFRQELVESFADPGLVPNETVDAVRNLMTSALTTWVRPAFPRCY